MLFHKRNSYISNERDLLVFLNEKNLLKPPISLKNDRIKTEITSLRRHNKPIRIGICRCSDRSLFNTATIRHLGSLTLNDFHKLSIDDPLTPSLNESRKSITNADEISPNVDSKKYSNKNKLLVQKRSASPNRDSGFIETDGTNTSMLTDRSLISNYNKRRSKISLEKSEDESMDTHKSLDSLQQSICKTTIEQPKTKPSGLVYSTQARDKNRRTQVDIPTQTLTDACFVYRRQVIKEDINEDEKAAIILRGREIAYEAANGPAIPSSMPNYTRDQIRELYGELDKKTRRLQDDEYTLHSPPMLNTPTDKPHWKLASPTKSKIIDECPLPKFRLDKTPDNDETLLMAAYLSTGLNNSRTKSIAPVDNFHTIMMNASAKVNEWANSNEIYLTPVENRPLIVDASPLLLDVQFNLKQLATTPTGNNDRPTLLHGIEQQTTTTTTAANASNQTFTNRQTRGSFRRQEHMIDTASTSPDSFEIVFETTPSTPGSCGMYLEPYMRYGYDLPSIDHDIRDSSWQHADHDDIDASMKNITPIESPTTPKIEANIHPSSIISQIIESDSLIDLDDGTTVSYHTAKESRLDNGRQSTISANSDETTSTLHQPTTRDDLINITSPDGSFYYDALPSPSQTNQQISTTIDKQNLLIDNITNLLEEIETFNRTNRQVLTTIDEEKARLPPEGEESTHNIDKLITIVDDIHQYNEIKPPNTMDNLLFIYDDINYEQTNLSIGNLVEVVQSIHQIPSCVDNLLFVYDDATTPSDEEVKPITNDSDEWSYDNLIADHEEQVDTDHLGTIVHEALAARFQKPIKFKEMDQIKPSSMDIDNLDYIVHEVLSATIEKSIHEIDNLESIVDTDNLGTIVHEALAARFQKPIKIKSPVHFQDEVNSEKYEVFINESPKQESFPSNFEDQTSAEKYEVYINESPKQESFPSNFEDQTSAEKYEVYINESPQQESFPSNFGDQVTSEKYEVFINESPKQESFPSDFEKPSDELADNTHTSETIIYEIESTIKSPSPPPPVSNLSQIVSDSLLTSSNYPHHHYSPNDNQIEFNITHKPLYDEEIFEEYGYRRTTTDPDTEDIVDKFEELYQRYTSGLDQYETTVQRFDDDINEFEKHLREQKETILTPISETTSEELITTIERAVDMSDESSRKKPDDFTSIITVKRQEKFIGKYGFDFVEGFDGKMKVLSIIDENYCPNLNIGDEIISINNDQSFKTYEQCQALLDSLWKDCYENVQITVIKSANIPIVQGK